MNSYKVNFQYPAPNGVLRSQSIIIAGKDAADAKKNAPEQIKRITDKDFRITTIKEF